ncbi:MAG: SMI1/KNR4 family protein [Myxococcales bacterium]|nr:SMI1/KNR4 family protein [Myxococcales bacterium]
MGAGLRAELERRGFGLREPVGSLALLGLIQAAPFALPSPYLDLLRVTNGGHGSVAQPDASATSRRRPIYVTPAERVLTEHRGWDFDEHTPDHLLFAADGEGAFYLLDAGGRVFTCRSAEVSTPALWSIDWQRFEDLVFGLGG